MQPSFDVVALLCGIVLLAFVTEAALGFGATVVAVTLGAQLMPLDRLLPAFVPINMVLSTALALRGRRFIAWRVLATRIAPAVAIGLACGLAVFRLQTVALLQLAFALFVVALAFVELVRVRAPEDTRPVARPMAAGLLAVGGFVHGLFGTGGPMIVYVMRRFVVDKSAFRATLAMSWLVLNVALIVNYATLGLLGATSLALSAPLLVVAVLALGIGEWIHRRVEARTFQAAVCAVLLLGGVTLAGRTALKLWSPA
jgi:uncharacterized membrane protein YfcA